MDESIRPKADDESLGDDRDAANERAAKDIMADPAAAAGMPAQPAFLQAPPGTPEQVQKVLNILPGLIGGVDEAIRDQTGVRTGVPFCLVIFAADGMALHAANFNPAAAKQALIDFGESLKVQPATAVLARGEGTIEVGGDTIGEAANDKPC